MEENTCAFVVGRRVEGVGVINSKLDVDPQRDDNASPMSSYRGMHVVNTDVW